MTAALPSETALDPSGRDEALIREGEAGGPWLVVITKANQEKKARFNLLNQGFEVYLPMRALDEVSAKRRGVEGVPLFPRVLFARAALDAYCWHTIFSTLGVVRVMCDPSKPRGVKPEFVERLREHELKGYLHLAPRVQEARKAAKDHRRWVKLGEVVDGLLSVAVDDQRKSVLVSLLTEGRASLTQDLRRR